MQIISPESAIDSDIFLAEPAAIQTNTITVHYDDSMSSSIAAFEGAMDTAASRISDASAAQVAQMMMEPLRAIDREAAELGELAQSSMESGDTMLPSQMINLSMRSQEFMFHSQLTANVANRTADGVSQLFRQQG